MDPQHENQLFFVLMIIQAKTVNAIHSFIHPFFKRAYPWGVPGAAARVGSSKHLYPSQQRIDGLLGCQGETN